MTEMFVFAEAGHEINIGDTLICEEESDGLTIRYLGCVPVGVVMNSPKMFRVVTVAGVCVMARPLRWYEMAWRRVSEVFSRCFLTGNRM